MNHLNVVKKNQVCATGEEFEDVQGFDYEDKSTGLKLSVRDGKTEIRFCGVLVDIAVLNAVAIERGKP